MYPAAVVSLPVSMAIIQVDLGLQ